MGRGRRGRRGRGRYRGPGADSDDDVELTELIELIDEEITLSWWTRPHDTDGEPVSLHVSDNEVCASTLSRNLQPYASEYEGYMGNYGNTMDRWYRRAAFGIGAL